MIFNTWVFAVFALTSIVLYWGAVPQRFKPIALIVMGSLFYVYNIPAYLILIVALGVVTFVIGRLMLRPNLSPRARKSLL